MNNIEKLKQLVLEMREALQNKAWLKFLTLAAEIAALLASMYGQLQTTTFAADVQLQRQFQGELDSLATDLTIDYEGLHAQHLSVSATDDPKALNPFTAIQIIRTLIDLIRMIRGMMG